MITVFGSINVDLVTRVVRVPGPGETVPGSDYALIPGGKGANQALAARRAGAEVRLAGAVGTDAMAAIALRELAAGGVDLSCVVRNDGPTGLALIAVNEDGDNSIVITPGANRRARADAIPPGTLKARDTLLVQMEVPFAQTLAAARIARDAGAEVILSLAPYAKVEPDDLLAFDAVIVNQHEAADLARHLGTTGDGPEAIAAALAHHLERTLIATLGPEGAIAAAPGAGIIRVPSLPVKVVDTTGAGDTFCGVLAAGLDRGMGLPEAMRRAAVAGALACTRAGAQTSFPTLAEIEAAAAA